MTITQMQHGKAKPVITVCGTEYNLKRDATDAATTFDHRRVEMSASGCNKVQEGFFVCWIIGSIMPAAGSIERPQRVVYIGFHRKQISMLPQDLTIQDLQGMHVYSSDETGFITKFTAEYFADDAAARAEERDPISCTVMPGNDDD